jgi:hypothetical protein
MLLLVARHMSPPPQFLRHGTVAPRNSKRWERSWTAAGKTSATTRGSPQHGVAGSGGEAKSPTTTALLPRRGSPPNERIRAVRADSADSPEPPLAEKSALVIGPWLAQKTPDVDFFIFRFFKNTCVISHFAKLCHWAQMPYQWYGCRVQFV